MDNSLTHVKVRAENMDQKSTHGRFHYIHRPRHLRQTHYSSLDSSPQNIVTLATATIQQGDNTTAINNRAEHFTSARNHATKVNDKEKIARSASRVNEEVLLRVKEG